jgi:adenosylcobinamide kinase/adenosylcobinamide-phosphate guanylyltransferase
VVLSPEDPTRLILVLGGARSGKSTFAERLAAQHAAAGRVTFLATSETNDQEMADRVAAHRAVRPGSWVTMECPTEVAAAVRAAAGPVFLLDCVTFWVSNLMFAAGDLGGTVPEGLGNFDKAFVPRAVEDAVAARVGAAVDDLLAALHETGSTLIAVSNEVGLGVVPEYPIARLYRDELGRANRRLAAAADEVYLLVAGIPVELKAIAADPFATPEAHEAPLRRRPPRLVPPPTSPTEEEHHE